MRVGFDAHTVGQRETGNETYARGLLAGFEEIGFPVETYSFNRLPFRLHHSHRIWPRQSTIRIPLSTPLVAIRDRLDIYHATYVLPPILSCQAVVAVHDISYALHPEWFRPSVQRMLALLVPAAMRKAARVITISESSKRDIVERHQVAPEKIAVTYLAPRPEFGVAAERSENRSPFFLYVGNVEPRKNFATIVRALALLRDRGFEIPLVIAGKPGWGMTDIRQLIAELALQDLIDFRGYVADEDLRELYANCSALVHPALHEGFGLTLLEAMMQNAPVLVANTSSVPEVVGESALLLPPCDVEAWCHAMYRVLHDSELRAALTSQGRDRASRFTWEKCARETVAVYESISA